MTSIDEGVMLEVEAGRVAIRDSWGDGCSRGCSLESDGSSRSCSCQSMAIFVVNAISACQKATGGEPRGKATSPSPSQAAVLSDAEIAAQLRKLLAAYPLGTMDWPLDVMANAASALERPAMLEGALEDARREIGKLVNGVWPSRTTLIGTLARVDAALSGHPSQAAVLGLVEALEMIAIVGRSGRIDELLEKMRHINNIATEALSRYRATPGQG